MENSGDIDNQNVDPKKSTLQDDASVNDKLSKVKILKSDIVTAKGTGSGLVLKIDPSVEWNDAQEAIIEFVAKRKAFLSGQSVILDWQGAQFSASAIQDLIQELRDLYQLTIRSGLERIVKIDAAKKAEGSSALPDFANSLSIFDGMVNFSDSDNASDSLAQKAADMDLQFKSTSASGLTEKQGDWDAPDCRIFYKTLRSGQRIETEHSVVLVGDVNSGAEVIAGGDVIVLGTLRGVVHAGAFDETGGGRFIFAMELNPTQLRIGSVISRGSAQPSKQPEMARVDGNNILVEPYSVKTVLGRMQGI